MEGVGPQEATEHSRQWMGDEQFCALGKGSKMDPTLPPPQSTCTFPLLPHPTSSPPNQRTLFHMELSMVQYYRRIRAGVPRKAEATETKGSVGTEQVQSVGQVEMTELEI